MTMRDAGEAFARKREARRWACLPDPISTEGPKAIDGY